MKSNFATMKEVAVHTRLAPGSRIERLLRFNERLRREEKVVQELHSWNMKLDRALVDVPGRVLPPERLIFGKNYRITSGQGDWTRDMQRASLLVSKELRHWVIIVSHRAHYNIQVNKFDYILNIIYGAIVATVVVSESMILLKKLSLKVI